MATLIVTEAEKRSLPTAELRGRPGAEPEVLRPWGNLLEPDFLIDRVQQNKNGPPSVLNFSVKPDLVWVVGVHLYLGPSVLKHWGR